MSATWYTADLHIGHRLVSDIRGFESTEDHDNWLYDLWHKSVQPNDTVYVLGDVAVSGYSYALALLKSLPGTKHLVAGNHDPVHPMHRQGYSRRFQEWLQVFETIQPFQRKRLNKVEFLMCHLPYSDVGDGAGRGEARYAQYRLPNLGLPLLHGHTHSTERFEGERQLHVGLDAFRGMVSQEYVIEWLGEQA